MTERTGLIARIRATVDVVYREVAKFGVVGAVAFVVDVYTFNLLRVGLWPVQEAPLAHKAITASVIATGVATLVAWVGNRLWTFRHRRRTAVHHELMLFLLMNGVGLAITAGCVAISHYGLGLTSVLADNVAKNVVGVGLASVFRFWAYRRFVFSEIRAVTTAGQPVAEPGRLSA